MITIPNPFPWIPSDTIKWPTTDRKLKLVNHWVADIDLILQHTTRRGLAIQAGGACGVWPSKLAMEFTKVITFEPVTDNFECLKENLKNFMNIDYWHGGLASCAGKAKPCRDDFEYGNSGAWYLKPGNEVTVIPIDEIPLDRCDLIMLDVEGAEYDVLVGALETIKEHWPLIVVENKKLPHMLGESLCPKLLYDLGYEIVGKYHNDEVYKKC